MSGSVYVSARNVESSTVGQLHGCQTLCMQPTTVPAFHTETSARKLLASHNDTLTWSLTLTWSSGGPSEPGPKRPEHACILKAAQAQPGRGDK